MPTDYDVCKHCGFSIALRNPSGSCDHLYYPSNCKVCKEMIAKEENADNEDAISQIEKIRAENNKNWMDVLRLALKVGPEETKELLRSIIKRDKEVTATLEKLVEEDK